MDNSDLEYSVQMMLEDPDAFQDKSRLRTDLPYLGFDNSCGKNWVYPTNYPKREYQYSMSKKALFQNTLVVLPTGLGKTFIAAVVMYNFYRWYPKSKVIFMAPARPLVAQQINACYDIMGISKEDTVEITGKKSKKQRQEFWKSKRVFYATPQAVLSDMLSPEYEFPVQDIRLVVVDEAHKAKGKYAYTEVINYISERNRTFRVLALSATPGRDLKDVREIAQNLLISHIEVRYETSFDVAPYTFKKLIKTEVVPLDSRIKRIRSALLEIMEPYVATLKEANVLTGNTGSHSKGWIIMQQNEFRRLATIERPPNYSDLASSFSTCVSFYYSLEVLERHGCRMFLNSFVDEDNRTGYKYFVNQNHHLKELLEELRQEMGITNIALDRSLNQSVTDNPNFDYGHPKFQVLQQKLLRHFSEDPDSKVIIFCELREAVLLIDILLSSHKPLIRPRKMVGQGSSSGIKSVTQKEQLAVMEEFKRGQSNCLIATCVVEEGIDVGDVMMIVCFDSNTNQTRYVQRIGRTGRKQQGKVLMLVSEGREHENLKKVLNQKDKTTQKLSNKKDTEWFLYKNSPRLVPQEFNPECLEVCFDIKETETVNEPSTSNAKAKNNKKSKETGPKPANKRRKAAVKKTTPPGTDMRNFFKPMDSSILLDATQPSQTSDYSPMRPLAKRSRTLPKPKPPVASTSTMIDFTLEQNSVEELTESDQEWEILQQIRNNHHKKSKIKKLEYATAKEILDSQYIGDELKKYLITKGDENLNQSNSVLRETEKCLKDISKENERFFDPQRLDMLLKCVKNVETQLKNEKVTEISLMKDPKLNESLPNLDFVPENVSTSLIESQFQPQSRPPRYNKPHVNTPLFNAFAITKVRAESTPIRKQAPTAPSTSRASLKSEKINEQEVLNSLGLKSLDDLFADDESFDQNDDSNLPEILDSVPISNHLNDETRKVDFGSKMRFSRNISTGPHFPKKRPCDAISSPMMSKNKRQMLEFVDLDNILGSSDDDLFGDDFEHSSPSKNDAKIVETGKDLNQESGQIESQNGHDALISAAYSQKESPNTVLEQELSKLNSSLTESLASELFDLEKTPKLQKSTPQTTRIEHVSTPKSTKQGTARLRKVTPKIIITDTINNPSSDQPPTKNSTTPDHLQNATRVLNETSPSIFSNRYSSQINKSNVGNSSDAILNGSVKVIPQKSPFASPLTQVIRPVVRNKRHRQILSDSEDENDFHDETDHQPVKKPKINNKRRPHCTFLDIEAGVSGNESEEDDPDMTGYSELQGFVVNNGTMNETVCPNMFAKYVESTRSPHSLNRFKIPQQLRPFNPEEIYSQAIPVDASQYDLNDSFVVDDEVDNTNQEMSELEIAEAVLEAARIEKKRNRRQMLIK